MLHPGLALGVLFVLAAGLTTAISIPLPAPSEWDQPSGAPAAPGEVFVGWTTDLRVWDRALSDAELTELTTSDRP